MREALPEAAALVDELRQMFGREWIDAALRRGMAMQRAQAQGREETAHGAVLRVEQGQTAIGALPRRVSAFEAERATRPGRRSA